MLRGNDQTSRYQAVEPQVSRLWKLFDEARAQSSTARLRARIDTGMHELLRKAQLDALASTTQIWSRSLSFPHGQGGNKISALPRQNEQI
jgi:hypothetical protein